MANSKPWHFKPGESGNPGGRPKGTGLTTLLEREVVKICPADAQGRTWRELIVLATMQLAIKGHPQALTQIWNRLDGAIPKDVTITDQRGVPTIHVIWGKDEPRTVNGKGSLPASLPPANGTS